MFGGTAPNVFESIAKIGPFVRSLTIYESFRRNPLYLPGPLVRTFMDEAERGPILPSLHFLSLGPLKWELGSEDVEGWHYSEHTLDFLGLFLAPSVKCLALKCQPASIDIDKIRNRAPSITDLRLWLPASNIHHLQVDQSTSISTWEYSTMKGLRSWEHLSALSISSAFLTSATVSLLGAIPALRSLEVKCSGVQGWQVLQVNPDCFPSLINLFIMDVYPHDAIYLLDQPNLMGRLTTLHLEVVDSVQPSSTVKQYVACIDSLCQHATVLSQLTFHPDVLLDERILQSLNTLNLTKLDMKSVPIPTDMASILLTFAPGLRYLDVDELSVPAIFLEELATQYQTLQFLAIGILLEESLEGRGLNTPIEGQVRLHYYIVCLDGSNEAKADARE